MEVQANTLIEYIFRAENTSNLKSDTLFLYLLSGCVKLDFDE